MKEKLSISIDKELVIKIEGVVKSGTYRNKSHFLEFAAARLLERDK